MQNFFAQIARGKFGEASCPSLAQTNIRARPNGAGTPGTFPGQK
jgi:hypothetical protein